MTVVWEITYSVRAQKDLDRIGTGIAKRVILLMDEIASDPYGMLEKMTNSPFYKFRIGQYRGIVDIVNHKLILHVIKIKHRSQVYKR